MQPSPCWRPVKPRRPKRGIDWILRTARPDGGWASRPGVGESSWVTALATLIPEEYLAEEATRRAIDWLLGTRGEDTTAIYALRRAPAWAIGIGGLRPSRLALDERRGGVGESDGSRSNCAGTRATAASLFANRGARYHRTEFPARAHVRRRRMESWRDQRLGLRYGTLSGNHGHGAVGAPRRSRPANGARLRRRPARFLRRARPTPKTGCGWDCARMVHLPEHYRPPEGVAYRTVSEVALYEIVKPRRAFLKGPLRALLKKSGGFA